MPWSQTAPSHHVSHTLNLHTNPYSLVCVHSSFTLNEMIDIPVLWACWCASLLHYVHASTNRWKCMEFLRCSRSFEKRTKLLVFKLFARTPGEAWSFVQLRPMDRWVQNVTVKQDTLYSSHWIQPEEPSPTSDTWWCHGWDQGLLFSLETWMSQNSPKNHEFWEML